MNGANDVNLTIDPSTVSIASIKLVITNLGGAVTSAPVSLTVLPVPPHSFVNYTNPAQIYFQSFDSLPVVTNNTVNTGNPVQIYQVGSAGKSRTTTSSVTVSNTAQLNCPPLRGSRPSPAEPGLTTSTRPTRRTTCRCVWP